MLPDPVSPSHSQLKWPWTIAMSRTLVGTIEVIAGGNTRLPMNPFQEIFDAQKSYFATGITRNACMEDRPA